MNAPAVLDGNIMQLEMLVLMSMNVSFMLLTTTITMYRPPVLAAALITLFVPTLMVLMNAHAIPVTKKTPMMYVSPRQSAMMIHVVIMPLVPNWTMVTCAPVQVVSQSMESQLVTIILNVLAMLVTLTVLLVKILVNALKIFIHVLMEHQLEHVLRPLVLLIVNVLAKESKLSKSSLQPVLSVMTSMNVTLNVPLQADHSSL